VNPGSSMPRSLKVWTSFSAQDDESRDQRSRIIRGENPKRAAGNARRSRRPFSLFGGRSVHDPFLAAIVVHGRLAMIAYSPRRRATDTAAPPSCPPAQAQPISARRMGVEFQGLEDGNRIRLADQRPIYATWARAGPARHRGRSWLRRARRDSLLHHLGSGPRPIDGVQIQLEPGHPRERTRVL